MNTLYNQLCEQEWGLLVIREQELRYQNLLEMTDAEWETWARDFITKSKHVRRSIRFVNRIAGMRAIYITNAMRMIHYTIRPSETDPLQVDMNLLRDMVDEPEKYGDDIAEALELEQRLSQTRKAWRVHYMWVRKQQEDPVCQRAARVFQAAYKQFKINKKMRAATKIQAAWRGFETRCNQRWTDCARCLCHRVSYWMIGGPDAVCQDCYYEVLYADYHEPEPEPEPEQDDEDEWRWQEQEERTCEYCERKQPMVGHACCAACYLNEKLYKHDEDEY